MKQVYLFKHNILYSDEAIIVAADNKEEAKSIVNKAIVEKEIFPDDFVLTEEIKGLYYDGESKILVNATFI